MKPRPEPFDYTSQFISTKLSTVLGFMHHAILSVRRDHFNAAVLQIVIETIAVVGSIADQFLRFCFDHIEIKSQLNERDLAVIRSISGNGQRQAVAVQDTHDFHVFSALCQAEFFSSTICWRQGRIDKAPSFIYYTARSKL
jgi:hypothetical protein